MELLATRFSLYWLELFTAQVSLSTANDINLHVNDFVNKSIQTGTLYLFYEGRQHS